MPTRVPKSFLPIRPHLSGDGLSPKKFVEHIQTHQLDRGFPRLLQSQASEDVEYFCLTSAEVAESTKKKEQDLFHIRVEDAVLLQDSIGFSLQLICRLDKQSNVVPFPEQRGDEGLEFAYLSSVPLSISRGDGLLSVEDYDALVSYIEREQQYPNREDWGVREQSLHQLFLLPSSEDFSISFRARVSGQCEYSGSYTFKLYDVGWKDLKVYDVWGVQQERRKTVYQKVRSL